MVSAAPDSPMLAPPFAERGYRRSVQALPMSWRRRARYLRVFGRLPDLRTPRRFTEKVTWRILRDRRDVLLGTCDKLQMKAHAVRTAPPGVRVPATLWQGTRLADLADLADVELTEHWVLKPNHRSGLVLFGQGRPDVDVLAQQTDGWLATEEWTVGGEWAYSQAVPALVVEERIGDTEAHLTDYKFYVFDGVVRLVQTDTDRFGEHGCRLYSPTWEYVGATRRFPTGAEVPRPALLAEMVEAAAAVGAGFDFMRVDLYEHDGEIWFGELTPYPGSGLVELDDAVDRRLGSWWRLPEQR